MARWTTWLRWLLSFGIRRRVSDDPKHSQGYNFFHAAQLRAWSHALTVRIAKVEGDREASFSAGSGLLMQFPNGRVAVLTAWHVLQEFRRLRETGSTVALVCDNMPIATPRLIFADVDRDIGLIEVPPTGRSGLKAIPYRPRLLWPPPRVVNDDDVMLCGFPKLLRVDGGEILHGDLNLILTVASASDTVFCLQLDWDTLVQAGTITLPPETTDFGGVSGGPVFLLDAEANPLVGVISQAGEKLPLWRIAPLHALPRDLDTRSTEEL